VEQTGEAKAKQRIVDADDLTVFRNNQRISSCLQLAFVIYIFFYIVVHCSAFGLTSTQGQQSEGGGELIFFFFLPVSQVALLHPASQSSETKN